VCSWQADIERRLEEGLNSSDPVDFEDLLRTKPDEVISYLANKGTQKLGSFITEVTRFPMPALFPRATSGAWRVHSNGETARSAVSSDSSHQTRPSNSCGLGRDTLLAARTACRSMHSTGALGFHSSCLLASCRMSRCCR
jgi:hypothetical protein